MSQLRDAVMFAMLRRMFDSAEKRRLKELQEQADLMYRAEIMATNQGRICEPGPNGCGQ